MCLSTSQMETISTGATWTRRQRSLLPYQPAPIRPTRLGFPLTMSRASAPSAEMATEAEAVWRKRRRLMLKGAAAGGALRSGFMGKDCAEARENAIPGRLPANHANRRELFTTDYTDNECPSKAAKSQF